MRKAFVYIVFVTVLFTSCKSEFEKVRSSGDINLLTEQAKTYYEAGDYVKAQSLFELIIPTYRGKKELEDIYYKYAYTYYNTKQYILAAYYFKNFSTTFPNSPYKEEIDFMSAYSNYKMSPIFRLDQTYTSTAIDELQIFANKYPDSERVLQANQLIDELRLKKEEKAFQQGELYYNTRQYQASVQSLENLMKDFPDTKRAEEVRFLIIKATYDLAENSVIDKQEERYTEVKERSERFLSRYPDSTFRNDANVINKKSIQKLKNISKDDRYKIKSAIFGS